MRARQHLRQAQRDLSKLKKELAYFDQTLCAIKIGDIGEMETLYSCKDQIQTYLALISVEINLAIHAAEMRKGNHNGRFGPREQGS